MAEAKKKYDEIVGMDMEGSRFNITLAQKYASMADLNSAKIVAEKALTFAWGSCNPEKIARAVENLGDIYVHRFEFEEALSLFREALGKEPENAGNMAVKIADIYLLLNQTGYAIEYYHKAIQLNPKLRKSVQSKLDGIQPDQAENGTAFQNHDGMSAKTVIDASSDSTLNYDERLANVLKKAEEYAGKIEHAAFHYICIEEVEESTWPKTPYAGKNTYQYDFQIIRNKKKISEKRKLLSLNGKKINKDNAKQRTLFQSRLKIFAVVDMLGKKNQGSYQYRILKEELFHGKAYLLLEVRKRIDISDSFQLEGTALINPDDGSVVRIELKPTSIVGYESRRQMAREMGFEDVVIKDVHWFEARKKGLNFPSRSLLTEHLKLGDLYMPHYSMAYEYSKYTFFTVHVKDVKVK